MNPDKLKKLEKLAKVLDNGDVELLRLIDELGGKTKRDIEGVLAVVNEALAVAERTKKLEGKKGKKGDKGDSGKDGKNGLDGKNGDTGAQGERGQDGKDGKDGRDGEDGKDGADGKDGEDGFIDDATVGYLEEELKRIDKKNGGYGQVVRKLRAGTNISIDESNMEYPVVNNTNPKITVSDTQPSNPSVNDIWIDTA